MDREGEDTGQHDLDGFHLRHDASPRSKPTQNRAPTASHGSERATDGYRRYRRIPALFHGVLLRRLVPCHDPPPIRMAVRIQTIPRHATQHHTTQSHSPIFRVERHLVGHLIIHSFQCINLPSLRPRPGPITPERGPDRTSIRQVHGVEHPHRAYCVVVVREDLDGIALIVVCYGGGVVNPYDGGVGGGSVG
jgi:hypothetical protein